MSNCDTFKNVKPYRATKLWNELVVAFKNGVPVQNHRYRMRNYDRTFTATEGVDWLLRYLRNHDEFGPDISRLQAIQLLQKFVKCNIIDDVTNKKKKTPEFQDGKKLYRMATTTAQSPTWKIHGRTPLRSVQNQNEPNRSLVLKETNLVTTKRRNDGLGSGQLRFDAKLDFAKEKIQPYSELSEGCATFLPSMPVLLSAKEVSDTWKNVTWNKLELSLGINALQEFLNPKNVCGKTIQHNATRIDRNGIVSVVDQSDNLPEWILCAMKCLARWPNASGSGSCLPKYEGFENDVFKVVKDHFCNSDEPLIPFQMFQMFFAAYVGIGKGQLNHLLVTKKSETVENKPNQKSSFWEENSLINEVHFETAFIEATPVTRMVSSVPRPGYSSLKRPSSATVRNEGRKLNDAENKFTRNRRCVSMECINKGRALRQLGSVGNLTKESSFPNLACSSHCLSEESLISDVTSKCSSNRPRSVSDSNSLILSSRKTTLPSFYKELSRTSCERLLKFVNIALLLVPTGQRKQLHLLLRLMKKIVDNKVLVLFPTGCTQFMLVKTFASSIIRPKVISGDDDVVFSCKIVDFLLDHCQEVFNRPNELVTEIAGILNQHTSAKYGYYNRCQSEPAITFCEQVTKEVYEAQKEVMSIQALSELLENIIRNPKLSKKEKEKKLKLFKSQYPEIYNHRYPTQSWFELEMQHNARKTGESNKLSLLERFFGLRL